MTRSLDAVRHEATRNQIIAAAERVFLAHGIRTTSMTQVAEEVGLGKPALYHYFSSKADLINATVEAVARRFRPFDDLPESATVRDGISYFVTRLVTAMSGSNADLRFLIVALVEQFDDPLERQHIRAGIMDFRTEARTLLQRGKDHGEVRSDVDVDQAANRLLADIFGLEMLYLVDPTIDFVGAGAKLEQDFIAAVTT